MQIKAKTATNFGIKENISTVEMDVSRGFLNSNIVGIPYAAVKESTERVCSAILNSGYDFPVKKITVNLAPTELKNDGSQLELANDTGDVYSIDLKRIWEDFIQIFHYLSSSTGTLMTPQYLKMK